MSWRSRPALRGPAEDVERACRAGPSSSPARGTRSSSTGRTSLFFASPVAGVRLVGQRRREMEGELVVAFELRRDALGEVAVGVQARDFVLVLDREQLEVVARDGLGQRGLARQLRALPPRAPWRRNRCSAWRTPRPGSAVRNSARRAIISSSDVDSRCDSGLSLRDRRGEHALGIDRGEASPAEALLVRLDRRAVQLDRAQDRRLATAGSARAGRRSRP